MTEAILWNLDCQVLSVLPVPDIDDRQQGAGCGVPISRGVGPAGVGMSASRSSSESRAVLPVVDGGALVVGERDGGEHVLQVVAWPRAAGLWLESFGV